jgi:hypothetical protein
VIYSSDAACIDKSRFDPIGSLAPIFGQVGADLA